VRARLLRVSHFSSPTLEILSSNTIKQPAAFSACHTRKCRNNHRQACETHRMAMAIPATTAVASIHPPALLQTDKQQAAIGMPILAGQEEEASHQGVEYGAPAAMAGNTPLATAVILRKEEMSQIQIGARSSS
jgi:hypothetical protein